MKKLQIIVYINSPITIRKKYNLEKKKTIIFNLLMKQ